MEHIGRLARMSVSGYRGRRFEPRQQYVVSLSKTLNPHCFSRLSCAMSTRWGHLYLFHKNLFFDHDYYCFLILLFMILRMNY